MAVVKHVAVVKPLADRAVVKHLADRMGGRPLADKKVVRPLTARAIVYKPADQQQMANVAGGQQQVTNIIFKLFCISVSTETTASMSHCPFRINSKRN